MSNGSSVVSILSVLVFRDSVVEIIPGGTLRDEFRYKTPLLKDTGPCWLDVGGTDTSSNVEDMEFVVVKSKVVDDASKTLDTNNSSGVAVVVDVWRPGSYDDVVDEGNGVPNPTELTRDCTTKGSRLVEGRMLSKVMLV